MGFMLTVGLAVALVVSLVGVAGVLIDRNIE